MADGASTDLYPIAILIDELKHDDVQYRVNSVQHLDAIATALGPSRTRDELLPFLLESLDDEDEVLLALADQLGRFAPFLGGATFAHLLLQPLEILASVEDVSVREKAVLSLNLVVDALRESDVRTHAWTVVSNLGSREWFACRMSACALLPRLFARLPAPSAAGVEAPAAAPAAATDASMDVEGAASSSSSSSPGGATRSDAFALYVKLSADDAPMVRRAASAAFADFATAVAEGALPPPSAAARSGGEAASAAAASSSSDGRGSDTGDLNLASVPPAVPRPVIVDAASPTTGAAAATRLLPVLTAFARDEQDSVRIVAVDNAVALARLANGGMTPVIGATAAADSPLLEAHGDLRSAVLEIAGTLACDRSWRVRWSAANRLAEVAEAVGRSLSSVAVIPIFESLLSDSEAEIRTAAAYRVADLARLATSEQLLRGVMPLVTRLSEDPADHVRVALASVVLMIAPVLGHEQTIDLLLPLFLRLLKDTSAQVRLNIISKLEPINAVVGLKLLSASLVPAIVDLTSEKSWRVRGAMIEYFELVASQLGSDFIDEQLTTHCIAWLTDPVYSVREAAVANLRKLMEIFGVAWAERVIVPRVLYLRTASEMAGPAADVLARNYLLRITALRCMVVLGEALPLTTLVTRLLPSILAFAKDPVPNLRLNVAQLLERLAPKLKLEPTALDAVRPVLRTLTADTDADVVSSNNGSGRVARDIELIRLDHSPRPPSTSCVPSQRYYAAKASASLQ